MSELPLAKNVKCTGLTYHGTGMEHGIDLPYFVLSADPSSSYWVTYETIEAEFASKRRAGALTPNGRVSPVVQSLAERGSRPTRRVRRCCPSSSDVK